MSHACMLEIAREVWSTKSWGSKTQLLRETMLIIGYRVCTRLGSDTATSTTPSANN